MKPLIALLALASFLWSAFLACAEEPGKQAEKKQKIVVFSAHPADSESGVGGLAATLAKQGHEDHAAVYGLVWKCYKQRTGGWNLYLFEIETGAESLAFQPQLYFDIGPVRELKKQVIDIYKSQGPAKIWRYNETMQHNRGAECGVKDAEAYFLVEAKVGSPLLPVTFLSTTGSVSKAAPSAR